MKLIINGKAQAWPAPLVMDVEHSEAIELRYSTFDTPNTCWLTLMTLGEVPQGVDQDRYECFVEVTFEQLRLFIDMAGKLMDEVEGSQ